MSYLDWKVGDKVVCVDAEWTNGGLAHFGVPCPLRAGAIYTIAEIVPATGVYARAGKAPICVNLAEVKKPIHPGVKHTQGFNAARFRPVQTRKTDISVFRALLNPSDHDREEYELEEFLLETEVTFK